MAKKQNSGKEKIARQILSTLVKKEDKKMEDTSEFCFKLIKGNQSLCENRQAAVDESKDSKATAELWKKENFSNKKRKVKRKEIR